MYTTKHKLYSVDKRVAYMYVKFSGTYQQFSIDIAYYMQFIDAILSPCNRWETEINKNEIKSLESEINLCATEREHKGRRDGALETTSHVTRIWGKIKTNKQQREKRKENQYSDYRDPNKEVHLHTGHLQK